MAATPAHRRGSARSDRAAPARRSRAARTADRTTSACAVRAAVASAKPAISSSRPIAAEVVSSSRPASIDQANQALRRFWPINCQECSSSSAHSGRASTSGPNSTPGEPKAVTVSVSSTAQHRLLSADNGARQQEQRPEGRDRAKLRQQIDAEHVVAGGAEGDIGKPERQRRTEIGADPVFPAKRQHGGEVAGRAAIQHQRQDQPHRRLQQHHQQHHQPRPGADQFDDQGGETHETSENAPARPDQPAAFRSRTFDKARQRAEATGARWRLATSAAGLRVHRP